MGSNEGVDIKVRTTGARKSARELDSVSARLGTMGRRGKVAAAGLNATGRASRSAAGGLRVAGRAALYGGAAIGGVLVYEVKRSTDAWQESRKVAAQTGAVIRSTGGVANVTAGHVGRLSTSISRKSGVDDEAIASGANLLLTFKKVRNEAGAGNDMFDRATRSAVDLSAAGFGSISSASKQLGKALNDPVKGLTALNRSGVTFTQGQKDKIKSLVASGNLLGAQQVLMREVESQVGGSAAAQATALDRVKVSWQNIQERIGKGVSPAVDAVAGKVDKFLVRAEPKVDALANRMGDLFGRKDIKLGDKLTLAGKDVRKTLAPWEKELEREIGKLDLGTHLADAFDAAAPKMADAAGRAAPRVAKAFVNAFIHAGPYGQLFTLGLLASKLGAFGALGRLAARRFTRSWGRNVKLPTPTPTPNTGAGAGGGAGGSRGRKSRGRKVGEVGLVAATLAEGPQMFGDLGRSLGLGPAFEHEAGRGWKSLGGPLAPESTGGRGDMVPKGMTLIPDPKDSRHFITVPKGAPRTQAVSPHTGPVTVIVETKTVLDGKVLTRSVERHQADKKARR